MSAEVGNKNQAIELEITQNKGESVKTPTQKIKVSVETMELSKECIPKYPITYLEVTPHLSLVDNNINDKKGVPTDEMIEYWTPDVMKSTSPIKPSVPETDTETHENETNEMLFIKRITPDGSTFMVEAAINPYNYPDNISKENFKFVTDSGAMVSVLSKRVYDSIPSEAQPQIITSNRNITGPNGAIIELYGTCDCKLELKGVEYTHNFYVCDIKEDGILGTDFMCDSHSCDLHIESLKGRNGRYKSQRKATWTIDGVQVVQLLPYKN